jgi:hypothetical protein
MSFILLLYWEGDKAHSNQQVKHRLNAFMMMTLSKTQYY